MPFDNPLPRAFTAAYIRTYVPALPGVYGISNSREWLLIGQSENVQGALLQHLQQTTSPLMGRTPTGFVYETCYSGHQATRFQRLIKEYTPLCNQ